MLRVFVFIKIIFIFYFILITADLTCENVKIYVLLKQKTKLIEKEKKLVVSLY